MTPFTFMDALIFYAVTYCAHHEGTATLYGLFSAIDAIDRTAPTFEELRDGIGRLCACSLIAELGEGFVPTGKGRALYDEVNALDLSVSKCCLLIATVLPRRCGAVEAGGITLAPERVEQARREYYGT